jgi:hypothetical protein
LDLYKELAKELFEELELQELIEESGELVEGSEEYLHFLVVLIVWP